MTLSALAAGAAFAQTAVSAVLNNASYALPGLSNSPIAQGSLMAIFGTNLASGNMTATAFPLQTNMGGTSVRITAGGQTVNALMIYTTAGQLGAILPSNTPVGAATMVVTNGTTSSAPFSFQVARSSFGIFTSNQAGSGPGAVQNVVTATDQPINALNRPARPGQTLILWGTGLGPTTANEAGGAVPGDLPINIEVFVGGRPAAVSYKGRSGCCAGIDQIAFVVPEGVEGCYVPVAVKIGDIVSNFSTISVARTGNVCSDPLSFNSADIEAAQANGNFRLGTVNLSRSRTTISTQGITVNSNIDVGSASFTRYTLQQFTASQGGSSEGFSVSLGGCSVMAFRATQEGGRPVDPIRPTILNAGNAISVRGPAGEKQLTRRPEGSYFAELGGGTELPSIPGLPGGIPGLPGATPLFLNPGGYTISASGGSDVGAFNVNFNLPPEVNWTNRPASNATLSRTSDLPVTWTGGAADAYVGISGLSFNQQVGAMFVCIERASAGRFTVPSYVLSVLPPSSGQIPGIMSISSGSAPARFTASGLDAGYVTSSSATSSTVSWR